MRLQVGRRARVFDSEDAEHGGRLGYRVLPNNGAADLRDPVAVALQFTAPPERALGDDPNAYRRVKTVAVCLEEDELRAALRVLEDERSRRAKERTR